MRPPNASTVLRKHLTPFEKRGIKQYKEVWSLGIAGEKVQETFPLRHGYDDSEGHYKMVIKDHIAYRYEVLELMGEGTFGRVLKCRDHKTKQLEAMKVIVNDQRFADEAMAEVEILELLQKKDELDVANVVRMKEHVHLRTETGTGGWRQWKRPPAGQTLGRCQTELVEDAETVGELNDRDSTLNEVSTGETNSRRTSRTAGPPKEELHHLFTD
ncbi:unnamed protein product [Boreogadus saida]